MSANLLAKPGIRRLIQATAQVYEQALDSPSISYEIPSEMRQKLEEDIFVFSGFKTYHQLKEASLLLRDDAGHIKPFSKFYQDVSQIKEKYNRNWLRAEYNFATASAEMASHWAEYATHKEYTNLQYHTALDDKVRESHAALEGITLPYEDSFWNTAFPPNGWNCRCHVVPVLKEDFPVSNSQTAQQSFEMFTEGSEIFRFNPGKQSAIFPPHHPYYGKQGYRHCKNPHLAHSLDSDPSDPCLVYHKLHEPEELVLAKEVKELMEKEKKSLMAATRKAYRENLRKDFYPTKLRKELLLYNGEMRDVRITFRGKGIDHLINDILVGKCPGLSIDDLIYLDEQITEARQMNRRKGDLNKVRSDSIEHFYYLDATIGESQVVIALAQEFIQGRVELYPFSIYEKKKS